MKVLQVSIRSDFGGGPQHILSLLRSLNASCEFFVASPPTGALANQLNFEAGKFFPLPHRRFTLSALIGLIRFVRQHDIDLIHSHGRGGGIFGRLVGYVTGIPVVHTHHGLYLERYRRVGQRLFIALEKVLNRLSCRIIFVSTSEKQACKEMGVVDESKSVVVPNGVSVPTQLRNGKKHQVLELIAVTRLEHEKGNARLIELIHRLSRHDIDFRLRIVGEGPERSTLESEAKARALLSKVEFLGARHDVPDLLRDSDLFVTCSYGEAHSIAMLEAMAHGLPVIATKVRGHTDLVENGINGFLFDEGDLEDGVNSIRILSRDRKLIDSMGGEACRMVREKYGIDVMARAIGVIYEQEINK